MITRAKVSAGALAAAALALALACNLAGILPPPPPPPCSTDSDCSGEAICFPDGCGDPGRGLIMQVTQLGVAQEFRVDELHSSTYDQELSRPAILTGQAVQATSSGPPVPFTGKITFKGSGSALYLPGIGRRIEAPTQPSSGQYSVGISTGQYSTLTANAETGVPPVPVGGGSWKVEPGSQTHLDVVFPPTSALVRITGTLLLSAAAGPLTTPMQVQVLELNSHRPLSQLALVDQLGGFSLLAPPLPSGGTTVEILATPKEGTVPSGAIVPNRIFTGIDIAVPLTSLVLQMGDFGSAVTVTGNVLDADGTPVGGARVHTERQVQGARNYTSDPTFTGPDGSFSVRSLPSFPGEPITLWVVPPPSSAAGTLELVIEVPLQGGSVGSLRCPKRVPVVGRVFRPTGEEAPASGVTVRAEPVAGVEGRKPPNSPVLTTTDLDGNFRLLVDPAEYRLDFLPPDTLPRVSRRVTVTPPLPGTDPLPVQVAPFTLWYGRTLSGTITGFASPAATGPTPLAGTSVELFRVVWEGDKQVSYSLAKVATDSNGQYRVVIPTTPPALLLSADGGTDGGG